MKWFRSRALLGLLTAGLLLGGLAARGELREWVRFVEGDSDLRQVFFKTVSLPSGNVLTPRPARETVEALGGLIRATPAEADLYALRAREAERQLEFEAAETHWKKFAEVSEDSAEGQLALADFYQRRLRPQEEVAALLAAGRSQTPAQERFFPARQQRSWRAFERSLAVIEAQALPGETTARQYSAWLERYPKQQALYTRFLDVLVEQNRVSDAEDLIGRYANAFPSDPLFAVLARAKLAGLASGEDALEVYDEAFQPLWPQGMINEYFGLAAKTRQLRGFLDRAKAALSANPENLPATAWIHHYYQRQRNSAAANAALSSFRQNKENRGLRWQADELLTLAELYRRANNYNEAARYNYALYSLPTATPEDAEQALAALIGLLLTAPEQPIEFGSGDLSFYRDIATMDDHPGFLNGVLSLLFNSEQPRQEFARQERTSAAYFHRARASELLDLFHSRFSYSQLRPALQVKLIEAYNTYGEGDGVIQAAKAFLEEFPESWQRSRVALLMADAYARQEQVNLEFAVYESLLRELAEQADSVPIGTPELTGALQSSPPPGMTPAARRAWLRNQARYARSRGRRVSPARSPEYARVLDRYIARLVSLRRERDALALYAREIESNPDDPGLYERLAAFLEQSGLGEQVEQVYRRAIARFQDRSWYDKLARWYMRQRSSGELRSLTREVIGVFSGTDLDTYFQQIVASGSLADQAYLQVNLFAHQRFPHNMTFVRNLLRAYSDPDTRDRAAWERLLREHWFHDDDLRSRFYAFLTRSGRLEAELRALESSLAPARAGNWEALVRENAAAAGIIAEAELWRCHFETAAPVLHALATEFPTDERMAHRASIVHRSVAYTYPSFTELAGNLEQGLRQYDPANRQRLSWAGDVLADRELYDQAAPYWNRMAEVEPGKPEGYLEAATVFWDYYQFDDALRLLELGRSKLGNPALFAYEVGAIHENQRDYEAAIDEYVRGSLAPQGNAGARRRLLRLARRTAYREQIDRVTAELVSGAAPEAAAVALRVGVLDVLRRHDDLAALLTRLAVQTTSLELLDQVSTLAVNHRVEDVRVKVVQKQIELTSDPVEKMRLRLALMRLYEGQKDLDSARSVIDTLYAEQPKILGVIRGAVDFHWRTKNHDRGLQVLLEAAAESYPDLQTKFRFEAVRKATGIERYEFAREHLRPLLDRKPFDAQYLAAMAGTFGGEGRYDALRDFYIQKINALREADLPAEAKKAQIAALRRGVIPALTELGDFSAAVDQYIEIINRYPDDEQLIQEAALYAGPRGRRQQLIDYYGRTTAESPNDFRYHRVLGWVQTHFENYAAAIGAFIRAAEVRPDHTGVLESRAALEERLMRFDDALRGYQRLYELTYENPRWMEKMAEIQARQGRSGDAVASLERALIEGRPEQPENYFAVARLLEEWNMSARAVPFAGTGVKLAGAYLYRESAYVQGARLYARLMTRARRHEEAYEQLQEEWKRSGRDGWRRRFVSAIESIGKAVDRFYTPDEKSVFAAFLLEAKAELNADEFERVLIPLAQSAVLADLEVQWRHERLLANPGRGTASAHERRLIELQQKRLKHDELGNQLEAYWNVYPRNNSRAYVLDRAAVAYQVAGAEDDEFRVRQRRGTNSERYLELLLKRQPDRLIGLAASGGGSRADNRAANYAVASGGVDLALRAVAARGRRLPPVWTRAYRGLVGLHYSRVAPEIDDAFAEILDGGAISQRIGRTLDRDQELAGDLWYYYGARYGEYLDLDNRPEADDYLPALLEGASARVSAYSDLANYYREVGAYDDALADYRHVLELQPGNAGAHHSLAGVLWSQGKRDEAIAEWRTALEAYTGQVQRSRLDPSFWNAVPTIVRTIGTHDLMPPLEAAIIELLRTYVSRNGGYRVSPLLQAFVESSPSRPQALASVLEFESEANDRVGYLEVLANAAWVPADQLETVLARVVEAAQQHSSRARGRAIFVAQQAVDKWRVRWIEHLLETKQFAKAGEAMEIQGQSLAPSLRPAHSPLAIRVAAGTGVLEELLSRYRRQPREAPALQHLQTAAKELRDNGDTDSARRLLDFAYSRQLERRDLSAANFLGLAELRFEQERAEDALALLRRMTLVSGEPFEQFVPAAELLAKVGRPDDAAGFLSERVEAVPWDVAARLKLAQARIASDETPEASARALTETASSAGAEYESRVAAAKLLRRIGANPRDLGSEELDVLASDVAPTAHVFRDYDYHSRLDRSEREASTQNTASQLQLLREALAIHPEAITPRVAAFRAARQTADHTLALATLMPLINQTGLGQQLFKQDSVFSEMQNQSKLQPWMADQFLSRKGLDNRERATIARELGDSAEILGRLDAAALHFQLALKMDLSPDAKQEVTVALEGVEEERSLRMDNA